MKKELARGTALAVMGESSLSRQRVSDLRGGLDGECRKGLGVGWAKWPWVGRPTESQAWPALGFVGSVPGSPGN